ncbi:SMI1/KNR4 family protein [Baaleninema sp.]|uniref:SMI1/KNR4 family protein n=1 Tax=Baaleninema sp. TaxID=3101197 RepID=UPI003CFD5AC5
MSTFDWERFLRQWSQELLESIEDRGEPLSLEAIESGWLGFPGATEAEILQAETRLGTRLPTSYREFLKVSNGWRRTTPFIDRLWSMENIEWFRVRHRAWIEAFVARDRRRQNNRTTGNNSFPIPSVPDETYLVYGDEQDCSQLRVEYLHTALEISRKGESAIYLLNPEIVTADGEWEAWFFSDLLPGADRYLSFRDMMQAEYRNFLELRNHGETDSTRPVVLILLF